MPLSNYALDHFVARDFTKFTQHGLIGIAEKHDQHQHWLTNCILNSVFVSQLPGQSKPFIFSIVRRAEHSISEYEIARSYLDYFINRGRKISDYFRALSHLEVSLSVAYQCYEFTRKKTQSDFFVKGDGSPLEKLNRIYSISKHFQESTLQPNQIHLFWFTNTGLSSSEVDITYSNIIEIMTELCDFAERLSTLRTSKTE